MSYWDKPVYKPNMFERSALTGLEVNHLQDLFSESNDYTSFLIVLENVFAAFEIDITRNIVLDNLTDSERNIKIAQVRNLQSTLDLLVKELNALLSQKIGIDNGEV